MQPQVRIRWGRRLLIILILFVIWRQSRALGFPSRKVLCSIGPTIPPEDCNFFAIDGGYCPIRYYCYRQLSESCNNYQEESKCEPGLTCSCNRCVGCIGHKCDTIICSQPGKLFPKRLPNSNRWIPFTRTRPRWQDLNEYTK